MNATLRWILIASIFVVLFFGFAAYFFLRSKAKQKQQEYKKQMKKFENPNPIKIDPIFLDLINNSNWLQEDFEFVLNTILHNKYKKNFFLEKNLYAFLVTNFQLANLENYYCDKEFVSQKQFDEFNKIIDKTKQKIKVEQKIEFEKIPENTFDFIYLDFFPKDENAIDFFYKQLTHRGMLVFKEKFNKKMSLELGKKISNKMIKHQFYKNGNYYLLVIAKI
ncbi:BC85_0335 family putative methyltransferase [Mesomycoplasma neurolyticum]|uniref:Methyltransferase n=1 Tax=Mesomycoplasma neurolyticum TaxID=2120 RepID=A0A449A6D2_9BACT|nr:hypothetical protein [Mesomycoplasma neurolyticum]VEU59788.1 Uncharacterised protein [Mesomycoplasma neurolyticum]